MPGRGCGACRPLGIRSERPARRPHGRASGRGLPARIEDVGLQAHRAAEDPHHKDREAAARQERRAGRDVPRHGQRHLIALPMAARPLVRDTRHIATATGHDAPFCVPNLRLKEPAGEHLSLIKLGRGPVGPALAKPGGFPCALFYPTPSRTSGNAHLRTWISIPIRTLPDSRSCHLQNR